MRPFRASEQRARGGTGCAPGAGPVATSAELQRSREGLIILCTAIAVQLFAFFETRFPHAVTVFGPKRRAAEVLRLLRRLSEDATSTPTFVRTNDAAIRCDL